jgi:hypothetical protein
VKKDFSLVLSIRFSKTGYCMVFPDEIWSTGMFTPGFFIMFSAFTPMVPENYREKSLVKYTLDLPHMVQGTFSGSLYF